MAGEHEFWLDLYNLASLVDDEAPCPARIEQLADAFWDYPRSCNMAYATIAIYSPMSSES